MNILKNYRFYQTAVFALIFLVPKTSCAVSIISTKSQYEQGGVRYFFTISEWDGNERMCYDVSASDCTVKIVGARAPGNIFYWINSTYIYDKLRPSWSASHILQQLKAKGLTVPFSGSLLVPTGTIVPDSFCISLADAHSWQNSGGVYELFGPCAQVLKPPVQCDIKGDTTINHGNISDAVVNGNEAAVTLQLTCTGVSRVKAAASKENPTGVKLRADGSLYSKISIDGKAAAEGVEIKVEAGFSTPVVIKSTLFSNGAVKPGEFLGSTVLTLSPP